MMSARKILPVVICFCGNSLIVRPGVRTAPHIIHLACSTVVAVHQPVPAIRIAQRIGGLPLGEACAVVAEEERMAEAGYVGLACKELRIKS